MHIPYINNLNNYGPEIIDPAENTIINIISNDTERKLLRKEYYTISLIKFGKLFYSKVYMCKKWIRCSYLVDHVFGAHCLCHEA